MTTEPDNIAATAGQMSIRAEHKQLTRERLVKASYETFATSGYAATTVRDITTAANVNRATFYLHFTSKAQALLAAVEYQLALNTVDRWKSLDDALVVGTRDAIHAWLAEASQWWLENAAFVSAWTEAQLLETDVRSALSQLYNRIGNSLTQYITSLPNNADQDRLKFLIELLIMQLQTVFTQYCTPDAEPATRAETLDALTDIWCRTLQI